MSLRSTPSQRSVVAPVEIQNIPCFDASTCPILNVVVYPDKAEVTRRINAEVQEGLSQIRMTNLSRSIDPSTIRVLIGGNSILNEVNFVTNSVLDESAEAGEKLDELKVKHAEILKELSDVEAKENTLRKQKEVLEAFANRVIKQNSDSNSVTDDCVSSFEMISKFLPMYEEQAAKISTGLTEAKVQHGTLDKQLKEATDEINATDPAKDGIIGREVQILIEAYEQEDIKLFVSYVVRDAGWVPKYDLRVHSRDKNLKVLYFGFVSQNTGEDWTDAKLSLSTASPSTSGLPVLGTHELHGRLAANLPSTPSLKRGRSHGTSTRRPRKPGWGRQGSLPNIMTDRPPSRDRRQSGDSLILRQSESRQPLPKYSVEHETSSIGIPNRHTIVSHNHEKVVRISTSDSVIEEDITLNGIHDHAGSDENMMQTVDLKDLALEDSLPVESRAAVISTTYGTATEDVTILSDKTGHKVNIAKIDLPAAFFYASCPRVCPHAFLRITARNDSAYALLAGQADIFLDGNFCTKSTMKDVCPTEEFEVDVGSDPTIKVAYRPLLRHKESGSKTHLISYTQDMDLKNSRKESVNIIVTDQLPRSNDDKVKVILHEPDVKKKKETTARLNHYNNIEWNVEIPADSTAKIKLRYSVEYPLSFDVMGLI